MRRSFRRAEELTLLFVLRLTSATFVLVAISPAWLVSSGVLISHECHHSSLHTSSIVGQTCLWSNRRAASHYMNSCGAVVWTLDRRCAVPFSVNGRRHDELRPRAVVRGEAHLLQHAAVHRQCRCSLRSLVACAPSNTARWVDALTRLESRPPRPCRLGPTPCRRCPPCRLMCARLRRALLVASAATA
eukprot:3248557-Pleurochrysis_carterae.AAC.1